MATAKVSETVAAPVDDVWRTASNFGGIEPNDMIAGCTVEGEGVGAVRTVTLVAGGEIIERLEALDNAARSYTYAIINDSPIPVKNYVSTVTVSAEGENAARIDWSGEFDANGVEDEKVIALIEGVYRSGIQRTRNKLGV